MMSEGFGRLLGSVVVLGCLVVAGMLVTVDSAAAKGQKVSELYRATPGTAKTANAAPIDIRIKRYSSDEDGQTLAEALAANGSSGLHKALKKLKWTGSISIQNQSAQTTYYTRAYDEGGKRNIVIVTDQSTVVSQAFKAEAKGKKPLTLITMSLDDDGNGEGEAKIGVDFVWDEAKGIPKLAGDPVGMVPLSEIKLIKKK